MKQHIILVVFSALIFIAEIIYMIIDKGKITDKEERKKTNFKRLILMAAMAFVIVTQVLKLLGY